MEFPPRKERGTLVSHAMILSVVALSLLAFARADDEITGKAEVFDGLSFTLVFLLAGYFVGWLPEIWAKTDRTAFEPLVIPAFVSLVLAYLYLGFRSYFIQPGVTSLSVFVQLFVMIVLLCRTR